MTCALHLQLSNAHCCTSHSVRGEEKPLPRFETLLQVLWADVKTLEAASKTPGMESLFCG